MQPSRQPTALPLALPCTHSRARTVGKGGYLHDGRGNAAHVGGGRRFWIGFLPTSPHPASPSAQQGHLKPPWGTLRGSPLPPWYPRTPWWDPRGPGGRRRARASTSGDVETAGGIPRAPGVPWRVPRGSRAAGGGGTHTHMGLLELEAQVLGQQRRLEPQRVDQLQESLAGGLLLEGVQQHVVQAVGVQLKVACQLRQQRNLRGGAPSESLSLSPRLFCMFEASNLCLSCMRPHIKMAVTA